MTSVGYVGLSLAVLLAQHNEVKAVDVIPEKVEKINHKISPIQDDYLFKINNCDVLNNGINTKKFKGAIISPEKGANAFLMLGRQGKRKGTYDLIDAVEIALKSNSKIPNLLLSAKTFFLILQNKSSGIPMPPVFL